MRKLLLISTSSTLEERLGDLLDSPRHVARVSSWPEAHRLLTKSSPAAVVVGSNLAQPSQATELVRLDDVLGKDGKRAYLISDNPNGQIAQWTQMFDTVEAVISPPASAADWNQFVDLLSPHLAAQEPESTPPPTAQPSPSSSPIEVMIRLPEITSGTLGKLPLSRIIYCLYSRSATGTLSLRSGQIERRFGFHDGRFVENPNHHDGESLRSAYAWPDGDFSFQPRHSVSGTPNSVYTIMIDGLVTHRPQREIMNGLMSRMDTYPVVTQFWAERQSSITWTTLSQFLDLCNGQRTLESIFSEMAHAVTEAFACAVFCRDTDLLVFRAEATSRSILIDYDHESTATTGQSSDSSPTKIERATGAERNELIEELRESLNALESMSPHDIFGLWKGCGREVVKQNYYKMIKEHHPDAYGGNVSAELRTLAQRIFINIRQAYAKLMKTETTQTTPPPDPDEASRQSRRDQVSTLKFEVSSSDLDDSSDPSDLSASSSSSTTQRRGRQKRHDTPIAMSREPTSTHPSLKEQSKGKPRHKSSGSRTLKEQSGPGTQQGPSSSRKAKARNRLKKKSKQRSSNRDSFTQRPSSDLFKSKASELGDDPTDPEVRKEKLKRLKKRRNSSAGRRPTPIGAVGPDRPGSRGTPKDTFNLGYKKFKKDRYGDALPYLKRAHEAEPDNALYKTLYAYCLFQTDSSQSQRAKKLLKSAIEAQHRQSLPDAHLYLGHILKADGKKRRAYKHFKRAHDLNPSSRDAEREIRLYERRQNSKSETKKKSKKSKSGGFFKNLFKD